MEGGAGGWWAQPISIACLSYGGTSQNQGELGLLIGVRFLLRPLGNLKWRARRLGGRTTRLDSQAASSDLIPPPLFLLYQEV